VGDGRYDIAGCSHDQYATMFACGLDSPGTVVLGTGTAWVINGISRVPLLDEEMFIVHPGRDILPGRFGFIISLGAAGRGFEHLLHRLGFNVSSIPSRREGQEPPMEPIEADLEQGTVSGVSDPEIIVQRFMEAVAAKVRFCLERLGPHATVSKIVMTGGATRCRTWVEILANICKTSIEAVRFPEWTAYGAAILARYAVTGQKPSGTWPSTIAVERFEPDSAQVSRYENWYRLHQRPFLERQALQPQPPRSKRMRI
jgi:sugar (pentulose or hexulose) kinase